MNQEKLNELISRAQKFIGKTIPVGMTVKDKQVSIDCEFVDTGKAISAGEEDSRSYTIKGVLKTPDGKIVQMPLIDIVRHFESKRG